MTWRDDASTSKKPIVRHPLPQPTSRDRVLSDPEMTAVLKAALKIIHTPYGVDHNTTYTGLRKNEAYTLTWPQITRDTITIPKEIAKNTPS